VSKLVNSDTCPRPTAQAPPVTLRCAGLVVEMDTLLPRPLTVLHTRSSDPQVA
jgi:hypothetical protein